MRTEQGKNITKNLLFNLISDFLSLEPLYKLNGIYDTRTDKSRDKKKEDFISLDFRYEPKQYNNVSYEMTLIFDKNLLSITYSKWTYKRTEEDETKKEILNIEDLDTQLIEHIKVLSYNLYNKNPYIAKI